MLYLFFFFLQNVTLLSTSLQLIWEWTMYISESTKPEHSLNFLLASLLSELTFLWKTSTAHEHERGGRDTCQTAQSWKTC